MTPGEAATMSLDYLPSSPDFQGSSTSTDDDDVREFQVEDINSCSSSDSETFEDALLEEESLDEEELFDTDGKLCYLHWCDKLKVPPVSQILKYLNGTCVYVNHYGLGFNGLCALAQALRVNKSVTKVELGDNNITDVGLTSFFDILSGNDVIKHINLSGNRIGMNGCKVLSRFLKEKTCRLKQLILSKNRLTDRDVKCILEALCDNESLKLLDLSRNYLTGKSAGLLHQFLTNRNTNLQHLDLSWNTLKAKGCEKVIAGLQHDATLRTLKLSWNGIQDEGAMLMSKFLKDLEVLEELDLLGNGITDKGFSAITNALSSQNSSLKVVRLDQNYINHQSNQGTESSHYENLGIQIRFNKSVLKLGYSNLED